MSVAVWLSVSAWHSVQTQTHFPRTSAMPLCPLAFGDLLTYANVRVAQWQKAVFHSQCPEQFIHSSTKLNVDIVTTGVCQ